MALPRFTPNRWAGQYFGVAVISRNLGKQHLQVESGLEHRYDDQLTIVQGKLDG